MATIKLILRKRANKDGTFPIVLRVTIDRAVSYIATGYIVKEDGWDAEKEQVRKNTFPNISRVNAHLAKQKTLAHDCLWLLQSTGQPITIEAIRQSVHPKEAPEKPIGDDFFVLANRFVNLLHQAGKYNRHKTEQGRIAIFKAYIGQDILPFDQITVTILQEFSAYLKGVRKIKERTISNYMILIRTIYNQAIKDGLVSRDNYPFGKQKLAIRMPEAIKVGLTADEVHTLENANLAGYASHARHVWLLSFYFAGMRLSDVLKLKWSDFKDDRLYYAMSKNSKVGSLKVPTKAQAIIKQYNRTNSPYILPELQGLEQASPYAIQKKIAHHGKRLEKSLKSIADGLNINKKLSMHVARHSFAQIASDKIPVQILQKLYRHSHISTTVGYQSHFTTQHTDDALDKVIGD